MVSLKQQRQSGFTIVELLIVIIIIGILAGLVITQILGANAKARDTERKTDLESITNQLEAYYTKTGGYPILATASTDGILNPAWRTANEFATGDSSKSLLDPTSSTLIGGTVPASPAATGPYTYIPLPAGCASPTDSTGAKLATSPTLCTSFTLTALLENKNDPQKDSSSTATQTFFIKKSATQ